MLIYDDGPSKIDIDPQGCGVYYVRFNHSYAGGTRNFEKKRRVDRGFLEGLVHELNKLLNEKPND